MCQVSTGVNRWVFISSGECGFVHDISSIWVEFYFKLLSKIPLIYLSHLPITKDNLTFQSDWTMKLSGCFLFMQWCLSFDLVRCFSPKQGFRLANVDFFLWLINLENLKKYFIMQRERQDYAQIFFSPLAKYLFLEVTEIHEKHWILHNCDASNARP